MIDKTLEALERLMPLFEKSMRELVFTAEKAGEVTADMNTLRAALAAPSAGPVDEVELLKGWKLNHIQFVRGSGTAEIGYLDAEDDRFFPVVTVDTGLYYQPQDAVPLAREILDRLAAPAQPPAAQLTITLRQAEKLLRFFGGHDAEVAVVVHGNNLRAWCVDCPEEGSDDLGPTEVDDDLAMQGRPAVPSVEAEPVRRLVDAAMAVATEFDIVAINRVWDAVYSFVEPRRRHEAYQLALAAMNTEAKNG